MYYLLYDPDDHDTPFEMVYETTGYCTTHCWFSLADSYLYSNPDSVSMSVTGWIDALGSNAYILHSFQSKPTKQLISDYLTFNHPELLI